MKEICHHAVAVRMFLKSLELIVSNFLKVHVIEVTFASCTSGFARFQSNAFQKSLISKHCLSYRIIKSYV